MIKTANLCTTQTKDVDWHVVESFDELIYLSLYGHPNAVKAFQELDDPASGGRRGGLGEWVRHRLVVVGSWLAPAALCHRVDQQGERHHHQHPVDTAGLFHTHRRDQK